MRLENQRSLSLLPLAGVLACVVALGLAVATAGAALIPALLLAFFGGYYVVRAQVQAVALSTHLRTLLVERRRLFTSSTRTFPLDGVTASYVVQGGLHSTKYYTLDISHNGRSIAELDPKEGYDQAGIDRLYAALLASQAPTATSVVS
jgi:hypothetical protein